MVRKSRGTKSSTTVESPAQSTVAIEVLPIIAGIDVVATVASFRGDLAFFRRFIGRFVEVNQNVVRETREAIASGKVDLAMAKIHEVRGTGGQLGCKRLQIAAGELEEALYSSAQDTSKEFAEFEAAAEEVFLSVQQWLKET
jgi:HPt (histidine-containing phosphotransfer) domain-containing protein